MSKHLSRMADAAGVQGFSRGFSIVLKGGENAMRAFSRKLLIPLFLCLLSWAWTVAGFIPLAEAQITEEAAQAQAAANQAQAAAVQAQAAADQAQAAVAQAQAAGQPEAVVQAAQAAAAQAQAAAA